MNTTTATAPLTAAELNNLIDSDAPIRAAYFTDETAYCGRCGGHGRISGFRHVENGVCFGCDGTGGEHTRTAAQQAEAARRERRRRRKQDEAEAAHRAAAAQAEAELESTRVAWIAANPEAAAALPDLPGDFGASLREQLRETGTLTENQAAAAVRVAAEVKADAAASSPVPTDKPRLVITGEVVKLRWVDNAYGGSEKMIVRDDRGFRVWGSVPAALNEDEDGMVSIDTALEEGQRVTFTAAVTPSDDDASFGFFKRPTKASRI